MIAVVTISIIVIALLIAMTAVSIAEGNWFMGVGFLVILGLFSAMLLVIRIPQYLIMLIKERG